MAVLGITAAIDLKKQEIPGLLIACCLALSLGRMIFLLTKGTFEPADALISLVPGIMLLFLSFITRQGVGYGDGLLLLSVGPAVGAVALVPGICVAVMVSGLFSGVLLALRKAGRKTRIPFVPFMTFGLGVLMLAPI